VFQVTLTVVGVVEFLVAVTPVGALGTVIPPPDELVVAEAYDD
jgi:hypothetical protein